MLFNFCFYSLPWNRMRQVVPAFIEKLIDFLRIEQMSKFLSNVQSKRVKMLVTWNVTWILKVKLNVHKIPPKIHNFPCKIKMTLVIIILFERSSIWMNDIEVKHRFIDIWDVKLIFLKAIKLKSWVVFVGLVLWTSELKPSRDIRVVSIVSSGNVKHIVFNFMIKHNSN